MRKRIKSFGYAFQGIFTLLREEPNARIHMLALAVVIAAGALFRVSTTEWLVLILMCGVVISLEILNSVVERIADFVSPARHPEIKKIKDLAAAGVLVAAITSVAIGLIVFLPKMLMIFN